MGPPSYTARNRSVPGGGAKRFLTRAKPARSQGPSPGAAVAVPEGMLRKRLPLIVLMLLVGFVAYAKDHRTQVRYVGPHPIPKEYGGGFCHIQVPHVHVYGPVDAKLQYREDPNGYYFVGDPVAYGWDGPKYAYYGHHPVP